MSNNPAPDSSNSGKEVTASPIANKSVIPSHHKVDKTIIFYDWDDTLFPSSYLFSKGYRLDTPKIDERTAKELAYLEKKVIELLKDSQEYGQVIIVTNAEENWVELSADKYFPTLRRTILPSLTIYSARTRYEHLFYNSPVKWKFYTFGECLYEFSRRKSCGIDEIDVISLGDSQYEREAILLIAKLCRNRRIKSIKFHERPSLSQLLLQIQLMTYSHPYIYAHTSDLDVTLAVGEPNVSRAALPKEYTDYISTSAETGESVQMVERASTN